MIWRWSFSTDTSCVMWRLVDRKRTTMSSTVAASWELVWEENSNSAFCETTCSMVFGNKVPKATCGPWPLTCLRISPPPGLQARSSPLSECFSDLQFARRHATGKTGLFGHGECCTSCQAGRGKCSFTEISLGPYRSISLSFLFNPWNHVTILSFVVSTTWNAPGEGNPARADMQGIPQHSLFEGETVKVDLKWRSFREYQNLHPSSECVCGVVCFWSLKIF